MFFWKNENSAQKFKSIFPNIYWLQERIWVIFSVIFRFVVMNGIVTWHTFITELDEILCVVIKLRFCCWLGLFDEFMSLLCDIYSWRESGIEIFHSIAMFSRKNWNFQFWDYKRFDFSLVFNNRNFQNSSTHSLQSDQKSC